MELYVIFYTVSLLLLILEVMLGMALGIALSGAITFLLLGILEWAGLLYGLNNYLIVGAVTFAIATFFVLRFFKNSVKKQTHTKDVNDY